MARKRDGFAEFVLDQLADLPRVRCTGMFGGFGLYHDTRFFGLIFKGRLYFKVTPETKARYVAYRMTPFRPSPKQTLASFYEVPVDVLEQADLLVDWAQEAVAAAAASRTGATSPRRDPRARARVRSRSSTRTRSRTATDKGARQSRRHKA